MSNYLDTLRRADAAAQTLAKPITAPTPPTQTGPTGAPAERQTGVVMPPTPGFGEAVQASFEQTQREDTSLSEVMADYTYFNDRNLELSRMIEQGAIPADVIAQHSAEAFTVPTTGEVFEEYDYHSLAAWSNENLETQFETDDSTMVEDMRVKRQNYEAIWERADGVAQFGRFIGSAAAIMTDPIVGLSLLVPGGQVKAGAGPLSNALRIGSQEAAIGMASETVVQGKVYPFKQRIDSPYSATDAIGNILLAGVGGFLFGGVEGAVRGRKVGEITDDLLGELPDDTDLGDVAANLYSLEQRIDDAAPRRNQTTAPDYDPNDLDLAMEVVGEDGQTRTLGDAIAEIDAEEAVLQERLNALRECLRP